jgi:hypothetical protein
MHLVGARVKEIARMRDIVVPRKQAFLSVDPAELHSAVRTKAIPRALRQAAGYKPAGRTGRGPVFRYG